MNLHIALYGALRDADPRGFVELEVPDGCDVGGVRERLLAYLLEHAPQVRAAIVRSSALASEEAVLRDHEAVPAGGRLAALPPVSGG